MAEHNNGDQTGTPADTKEFVLPDFPDELERKTKEAEFAKVMAVFASRKREIEEEERVLDAEKRARKESEAREAARQDRKRKRSSLPSLFVDNDAEEAQEASSDSPTLSTRTEPRFKPTTRGQAAHDAAATTKDWTPASNTAAGSNATDERTHEGDHLNPTSPTKPFSALTLKSAGKRKSEAGNADSSPSTHPFAPPRKPTKKAGTTVSTQTLNNHAKLDRGNSRTNLQALKHLRALVKEAEVKCDGQEVPEVFEKLRTKVHAMEFYGFLSDVGADSLVEQSKVLGNDGGLPAVRASSSGVQYPKDIILDCSALHFRWSSGDYDPHLLRGITSSTSKNQDNKSTRHHKVDPSYAFKYDCSYFGPGHLEIGQWWPLQVCAMRDGAHGEMEGGIHGKTGQGAFSIVMSGGGYANIDNGDSIEYCGTPSATKASPSMNTNHMLKSYKDGKQIRVLRSSSLRNDNPYRPAMGLRYDGLYVIDSFNVLDKDTAMYRFKMTRVPRQTPIRYQGVGARPNEEELNQFAKIKELFGK